MLFALRGGGGLISRKKRYVTLAWPQSAWGWAICSFDVDWVSFQFGAFHFGARQFDACQFGAVPVRRVSVRRVSVWRDASLARFTLARFPFLCLF